MEFDQHQEKLQAVSDAVHVVIKKSQANGKSQRAAVHLRGGEILIGDVTKFSESWEGKFLRGGSITLSVPGYLPREIDYCEIDAIAPM